MIKKLYRYIRDNFKIAFKSVMYNKKQYVYFFIALFLIQTFSAVIIMSASVSNSIEHKIISSEYDHHIVLYDLNSIQKTHLQNGAMNSFNSGMYTARYVENKNLGDNTVLYDAYLFFTDKDPRNGFTMFNEKIMPEINSTASGNNHYGETTPLLEYYDRVTSNNVRYILVAALMMILSILLITALYNIRINNFKFDYGIYMTFGANYMTLTKTAFWELLCVSFLTFAPAVIAGFIINTLIYIASDVGFVFNFTSVLLMVLINVIVITVSVFLPMKNMSMKTPLSLISSADNSNLVTSPLRSFRLTKSAGRKLPSFIRMFPDGLELFGLWRFRKYVLKTLMIAVAFCSVFVAGIYISEIYSTSRDTIEPEFTIEFFGEYSCTEETANELMSLSDKFTGIRRTLEKPALYVYSHVLVNADDARPLANLVVNNKTPRDPVGQKFTGNYLAANAFAYTAADKTVIDDLVNGAIKHNIVGDPYKVLEDDKYVIVTNYLSNNKKFDFEPGDKILIASCISRPRPVDMYAQGNDRIKEELEYYTFEYNEYEICAVTDGFATYNNAPIFMSNAAYERSAKEPAYYYFADMFVDYNATSEQIEQIYADLREISAYYSGNMQVIKNASISEHRITVQKNAYAMILAVSILIMFISPILWFFSQTLFIAKREHEYDILIWFGSKRADIGRSSKVTALVLSIISTVFCSVMSFILVFAIFKITNNVLPYFNKTNAFYEFNMSAIGLTLGIVVSVVCATLSSILPVKGYLKRLHEKENSEEYVDLGDE